MLQVHYIINVVHSGMGNKINIDGTILSDSLNRASITVEATSNENIIRFNTNSSEKLTIDSSGNLAVKSGNIVLGGSTHYTTISPNTSGNGLTLKLPNSAGTSGQYLKTDGSGNLSWSTVSSGATDSITEGNTTVETVDTGSDGHIKFTTDGTERMRLDNTGALLIDTLGEKTSAAGVTIDGVLVKDNKVRVGDGTNNTTLAAAGSGGALTLTLPSSAGSSGQYLQTDGSGALSWNTVSSGSSDNITEGDTIVEAVDTGSDGHIKFSTDGTERMRLDNNGKLGIALTEPANTLQVKGEIGAARLAGFNDINPFAGVNRVLVKTNNGVKRFGSFSNYTGDSEGGGHFGGSERNGTGNPVIANTSSLEIVQVLDKNNGDCYILESDGNVKVFGSNNSGELGVGNTSSQSTLINSNFKTVADGNSTKIIKLAAGNEHVLALTDNGRILACGRNNEAQLGIGNTTSQTTPVFVNTFSGSSDEYFAVDIICTMRNSYAVTRDGKLWSWGNEV